ncbi:MAG: site-2 protease family protein [Candidatus Acidiferrales bacterium]|jgi:Zn-dependent protease/predicted transcriptional regulator
MAQPAQSEKGSGIRLGRILGIPIYAHTSWFLIFLLITLSLRTQFTSQHPSWTPVQHWTLGIITSVLFFASVIFHEMSHSVVAMRYHLQVRSITLFVFGGLARIERDPPNARQEFNIAIAGPLSSLFLAGCFWLIWHFVHGSEMVSAAAHWLAVINFMLAAFNLVPGFPLDGGRVLRGIAWGITGNFMRATQIASDAGRFFAYLMIAIGAWQALNGNWAGGLWLAFIGWFLLEAARESFAQVAIRDTLSDVRAEDIMAKDIPTVARDISIEEYIHEVLKTGRRCHIVTGAGTPVGLVTLQSARSVPKETWPSTSIQAVMVPMERVERASPDEPALHVLERMQAADINQMPIVSGDHLVGIIGRDAILRVLQTRLQAGHLAKS